MTQFKQLDLDFIDDELTAIASSAPARPPSGWARAVREALGMTRSQLARRVGVSPSTVSDLERSEANGTLTLESLEKLARGLGGRVVYAIVPPAGKTFRQMVDEQAQLVARKRVQRVAHTMDLEAQAIDQKQQAKQLQRVVDSLLRGSRRMLWR